MSIQNWQGEDGLRAILVMDTKFTPPLVCPEALAVRRDYARSWLEDRGYFLSPATTGNRITGYVLYDYGAYVRLLETTDYDAALIAAILAVEGD